MASKKLYVSKPFSWDNVNGDLTQDPTQADINSVASAPPAAAPAAPAPMAPPPMQMPQLARGIPGPAPLSSIIKQVRQDPMIAEQQARLDALDAQTKGAEAAIPNQLNLSPLAALADYVTKSDTGQEGRALASYAPNAPMSPEERAKLLIGYGEKQAQAHQDMAKTILGAADNVRANNSAMLGFRQSAADAKAVQAALGAYQKGLPKIQDKLNAAYEGMQAVADPQGLNSVGAARTLLLKAFGMNRYNESEAWNLLPPNAQSQLTTLQNWTGGQDNPLTPAQKQALNTTFQVLAKNAEDQHNILKANSLQTYSLGSPNADPLKLAALQQQVGAPTDAFIQTNKQKFQATPVNDYLKSGGAQGSGVAALFQQMLQAKKGASNGR